MQSSRFDNKSFPVMYWFRLLIAIDQLVNALLGGFPDETLSGRLGRAYSKPLPLWFVRPCKFFVDLLFLFLMAEKNHCINSIEPEDAFHKRRETWKWYR